MIEFEGKRILRVFPNRTRATPDDELVVIGPPPLIREEVDEVHISVLFTYDVAYARELKLGYDEVYHDVPVKIGGPALNSPCLEKFVPGMYMKDGYTITTRGCPRNCWYCYVPKREGKLTELPIEEGWNIQDNNILAASEKHQMAVYEMLNKQFPRWHKRAEFIGGLDSWLLTKEIAAELKRIKTARLFLAYDKASGLEPLRRAGVMLAEAGFSKAQCYCYVLIGYEKDTFEDAEVRLREAYALGFTPFAMLYRDDEGKVNNQWKHFQRLWIRPAIIRKLCEEGLEPDYNWSKARAAHDHENQTKMFSGSDE